LIVGDCDITIEYYTNYACPVCNSSQYEQISDQCTGTGYNVWRQRKAGNLKKKKKNSTKQF